MRLRWPYLFILLLFSAGCSATESTPAGTPTSPPITAQPALADTIEPPVSRTPAPVVDATEETIVTADTIVTEEIGATEEPAATAEPAATEETTMVDNPADADVEFVRAIQAADGTWTFHVTVRHPDTGWEDYADGWDVVTPEGTVLKRSAGDPFTRLLLHPHENEQPFTRSQSGVEIPNGIAFVTVRAHDLVDGFGGREVKIDLSLDQGDGYTVERQ